MHPLFKKALDELLGELAVDNANYYRMQAAIKQGDNVIDGREKFAEKELQDTIDKFKEELKHEPN
jgi:hypothetical protein